MSMSIAGWDEKNDMFPHSDAIPASSWVTFTQFDGGVGAT
jgi:hypothetical protein